MRTNIEIDDKLMKETLRVTGLKTKREAVELALTELVRIRKQADVKKLRGLFHWEGDLEKMRLDR